jgi:methionyl-tRNA synthetase
MESVHFCQSCGMPLTSEEVKGTENNGLKNNDYCKHCYDDGHFKKPKMNLEDMKNAVKAHMEKNNLPHYMIQKALTILPALKRWKNKQFIL